MSRIISMSLGASINGDGTSPVEIAATTAVESGINFVVAAGNSGYSGFNTVGIPASAKKVITVGAVDNNKNIAPFSSRGPTKDNRTKPEVTSPGVNIISSVPTGNCELCDPSGYRSLSGTSMATPHVAGIVALLKEANQSLTPEQIRQILIDGAEDKGEIGADNIYGWGVVKFLDSILTVSPREHELSIKEIKTDEIYNTTTPIKITAKIKNKGLANESNIKVIFYVNGIEQSNRVIPSLNAGSETSVDFFYATTTEGNYSIETAVEPVAGEDIILDNKLSKEIVVKNIIGEIKAVVVDSWGTDKSMWAIFDDLNKNWFEYGNYKLTIDYKSLDKEDITYQDIKNTNADVLIISDAWANGDFGMYHEFKDSEIQAIKQYVEEGHGLIGTSGTLSERVSNNIKLAELFGLKDKIGLWNDFEAAEGRALSDKKMEILIRDNILTKNLPSDYYPGDSASVLNLEVNKEKGTVNVAQAENRKDIFVTAYKPSKGASIYFTYMPEIIYANEYDKQFFYNSLVWAKFNTGDMVKDISLVDLEIEKIIKFNETKIIKTKLKNNGLNIENITVEFKVDNISRENYTISLAPKQEILVNFSYTADILGEHNLSIEALPITGETYLINNKIVKQIYVPRANLIGFRDYGVDNNGNGLFENLLVEISFEVIEETNVRVSSTLFSQLGAYLDNTLNETVLEPGRQNLTLSFNGLQLRRMGLNGPYKLFDFIALEFSNEQERTFSSIENPYNTSAYTYEQFESYPDLLVYSVKDYGEYRKIVGEPFNVSVEVMNTGIEDASNVNISIYREGEEIPLASSYIGNLSFGEIKSAELTIIPNQIGYSSYIINVSAPGDKNLENNFYYTSYEIVPRGADIAGWFYPQDQVIVNQAAIFKAVISNIGVETAEKVSVYFSEGEYNKTNKFVIGTLSPNEGKEVFLSITPKEIGQKSISGYIEAANDINLDNNNFSISFEVAQEGADVTGYFSILAYPIVVNNQTGITIYLQNQGTEKAKNVRAEFFEEFNNTLTKIGETKTRDLNTKESYEEKFKWIPKHEGNILYKLIITTDNDINLQNNEYGMWLDIKPAVPDIIGNFESWKTNILSFNETNNLSFWIYNRGGSDAKNVILNLYEEIEGNYSLITSINLGDVKKGYEKEATLNYTPLKTGWINFKLNMSAENEAEQYKDNNEIYFSLKSVSGADLRLWLEYPWKAIVNQTQTITSNIWNKGIRKAENVSVNFYSKKDKAYNFDGINDYINIPSSASLGLSSEYTISAWIYRTRDSNTYERIVSKSNITSYDYWLQISNTDNLQTGCIKTDKTSTYLTGIGTVPLNSWTHIVGVKNSTSFVLYLNGNLDAQGVSAGTIGNCRVLALPLNIGRIGSNNVWYYNFSGIIDELRIYNRSLTKKEILDLYNKEDIRNGLIAYFPFEGNANDLSGKNNHGNVSGATITRGIEGLDYILLDSKNLGNLSIDDEKKEFFNYMPLLVGSTGLKVNVSANNEVDYSDNENYLFLDILNSGPDLAVELQPWKVKSFVVNHSVSIPAMVSNFGDKDASDLIFNLYEVEDMPEGEKLILVDNRSLKKLAKNETQELTFVYTPFKSGQIKLMLNGSLNGDIYIYDNYDYEYIEVIESLTDISGTIFFYEPYALANKSNFVDIVIRDNDIIGAENIKVYLYDNDVSIKNISVDSLKAGETKSFIKIEWVPNSTGVHNLTLIVNASKDINPKNNIYSKLIDVYNQREVTFNIKNHLGQNLARYLSINGDKKWVESPYNESIIDRGNLDLGLNTLYYTDKNYQEAFVAFLGSELKDKINILSEYYENVSNGSLLFDIIYINKPEWNYSNISYSLLIYDSLRTFSFADIYICKAWNFSAIKCDSDWIKANKTFAYVGKEGIYLTGSYDGDFEAIGLVTREILEKELPSTPTSRGSSSRSGGRISTTRGISNIDMQAFSSRAANEELRIRVDNPNSAIDYISIVFAGLQQAGYIRSNQIEVLPANVFLPEKKVYTYFEIIHDFSNENVKEGEILFKVKKQWMDENKISPENILLLRYDNGWKELQTSFIKSDEIYNYYSSKVSAFSIFAIAATEEITKLAPKKEAVSPYLLWALVGSLIFLIILIVVIIIILRAKQKKLIAPEVIKPKVEIAEKIEPQISEELIRQAKEIVSDAREKGYADYAIREKFRECGWSDEQIDKILR